MLSYIFKTGFKNLGARKMFTFASIGTIACSVLVYCIFFLVASNIEEVVHRVETTVGIQVFFDEGLDEESIKYIATNNFYTDYVKSMNFKSSNEAWESFKKDYFDNKTELAEAFENDNPLSDSASYEILLNDISKQYEYVNMIKNVPGVRQVNYSNVLIDTLTKLNFGISTFCLVFIVLLLLIAIIIISNTISIASQFRKKENEIMKLIGATNYMIRAPFVLEGFFIGLFGSIIPILIVCISYNYIMNYLVSKAAFAKNLFEPISIFRIIPMMSFLSISVSCLVCMIVSFLTIRKHLKI